MLVLSSIWIPPTSQWVFSMSLNARPSPVPTVAPKRPTPTPNAASVTRSSDSRGRYFMTGIFFSGGTGSSRHRAIRPAGGSIGGRRRAIGGSAESPNSPSGGASRRESAVHLRPNTVATSAPVAVASLIDGLTAVIPDTPVAVRVTRLSSPVATATLYTSDRPSWSETKYRRRPSPDQRGETCFPAAKAATGSIADESASIRARRYAPNSSAATSLVNRSVANAIDRPSGCHDG